jgi:putative tryptophan/tyrosine transport system permease protein
MAEKPLTTSLNPVAAPRRWPLSPFLVRLLVVSVVIGVFMQYFGVNIGSLGQGIAYSLVGVSVFISFRILHFPDLTVDGAFPIGGAVCAMLIVGGTRAEVTLLAAFLAGALAGLITALITLLFRVEGLLSSIIVITGAYTITLRVMDARSNVALLGERTILTPYQQTVRAWLIENFGSGMRRHSNNLVEIAVFGVIVIVVLLALTWFMHTEIGLVLRASGTNSQAVRAFGVNHHLMIILALMLANGLAGLAGSLAVQQLGFADVSLGFGIIVRGLAALLVGEVLLRPRSIGEKLLAAAVGMVIFDVSRAWVFAALSLPTTDIRLVSALVVLSALAAPNLIDRWQEWRKRRWHRAEPEPKQQEVS